MRPTFTIHPARSPEHSRARRITHAIPTNLPIRDFAACAHHSSPLFGASFPAATAMRLSCFSSALCPAKLSTLSPSEYVCPPDPFAGCSLSYCFAPFLCYFLAPLLLSPSGPPLASLYYGTRLEQPGRSSPAQFFR